MFKTFVTVDTHQLFKSFISQTTSIRLEHSSSNAENSFVNNFKNADYFFQLRVTIVCKSAQHCTAFNLKWNGQWSQHSCASVYWTRSRWSRKPMVLLSFFTSIWLIMVDMQVISVMEKYFRLGLKHCTIMNLPQCCWSGDGSALWWPMFPRAFCQ